MATAKKTTVTKKVATLDLSKLDAPFDAVDIRCRPIRVTGRRAAVAFYADARAIQNRFDDVVGPARWQTKYERYPDGAAKCAIGVEVEPGKWVWKEDASDASDIESTKGAISKSFRRAAVAWGVGRYLYYVDDVWVNLDAKKRIIQPNEVVAAFVDGTLREYAAQQEADAPEEANPFREYAEKKERAKTNGKRAKRELSTTKLTNLLVHRLGEVGLAATWVRTLVVVACGDPQADLDSTANLTNAGQYFSTVRDLVREHFEVEGKAAKKYVMRFYREATDNAFFLDYDEADAVFDQIFLATD